MMVVRRAGKHAPVRLPKHGLEHGTYIHDSVPLIICNSRAYCELSRSAIQINLRQKAEPRREEGARIAHRHTVLPPE